MPENFPIDANDRTLSIAIQFSEERAVTIRPSFPMAAQQQQHNPSEIYKVPWYPNEFPEMQEAVYAKLTKVDELGIMVQLPEYGNKEGMIPMGQYTTRRSRRLPKNVKIGKVVVALVSGVDAEKGNMDLTRQGLKDEVQEACQKRFEDYRNLMNLLYFVSTKEDAIPFPQLVAQVAYPLHIKYGNAYRALQKSGIDSTIIDELEISDEVKELMRREIQKMFKPQTARIHCQFEAEVHGCSGVNGLREALSSGYDAAPEEQDLKIAVIAAPLYAGTLTTQTEEHGVKVLEAVLARIQETIAKYHGKFTVKEPPRAINQAELDRFNKQLSDLTVREEDVDMDELETQ